MAEKEEKKVNKKLIQISIGIIIAGMIIGVSWISKNADIFPFYEMVELKLLDQRFLIRGPIPMDQNVGTIDVDALTLGVEGRFQDWTRDKYAQVIDALSAMNARMVGFDIFFPEASTTEILKKQDLAGAQVKSVDDVLDLFRDYDRDLRESMNNAGNVFLGQSFQIAANQEDADWIRENIGEKNEDKRKALEYLEPFSKEYPDWPASKLTFYTDIEPPRTMLMEAARGVGTL